MKLGVALVGLAVFVSAVLALPTPLEEQLNEQYRGEKYGEPQTGNDLDDNEVRELDAIGSSNLLRNLDSLGGGHLLRQTRRPGLDSLSGGGFGVSKRADSLSGQSFGTQKRNFDEIDRNGFNGFVKKNFDEIDRNGFNGFIKKNFDEIDRNGFDTFVKRNFDEIDRVGFSSFLKRSIPELLTRYYKHKNSQ